MSWPSPARTLGFAQSPGVFRTLGLVRVLGELNPIVTVVTAVWTLTTMVGAVRQALDYTSTLRAVAVCVTGWVLALAMLWVVGVFSRHRSGDACVDRSPPVDHPVRRRR